MGGKPRQRPAPRDPFLGQRRIGGKLRSAYQVALRRFRRNPDVTGVTIGIRHTGGVPLDELTIRIHVRRKIDPEALRPDRLLAGAVEGFVIDVAETDILDHRTTARDPIQPGLSVGPLGGGAGTIGAVVRERGTGRPCILSARHVLRSQTTRRILQPASSDGGNDGHLIAMALRSSRPFDAAVAVLGGHRAASAIPFGMTTVLQGTRWPFVGQVLEKSGRSTSITRARIVDIGHIDPLPAAFRLEPIPAGPAVICLPGDSGAVWRDATTRYGVGLHSKGAADGSYGIATFLKDILLDDYLAITL